MTTLNENILIIPSILACDFTKLGEEAKRAEEALSDRLHIDVMDGHFVPNLSMGPQIVAAINRSTDLFLDVHLMMYNPFEYIEPFVRAGADLISFHIEATEDVMETIDYIKKCGNKVGIAINPETPISLITPYLAYIDQILIMTVNPGFGGQPFQEESLARIQEAYELCNMYYKVSPNKDHRITIEVDGGIDTQSAVLCRKSGASSFVAGTYLFKATNMKKTIEEMRQTLLSTKIET